MLKRTKLIRFFTRKKWNGSGAASPTGMRSASTSEMWYATIHELILERFITVLCDGDYSALIISGHPSAETLATAWQGIYDQYLDAMKDSQRAYIIKLAGEINVLQTNINLTELIITRLELEYSEKYREQLGKIIPQVAKLDPSDPVKYEAELNRARVIAKRFKVKLESKEAEFKRLLPVKEEAKPVDREHFTNLIIHASKHMGFYVDRRTVTVAEFVRMMVDMREKYEHLHRQTLKK